MVNTLRDSDAPAYIGYDDIVGVSEPMQQLYIKIDKIAIHDVTVLINGESGTGKELVATCIHDHSSRKNKPFVKINCAALAESLLESELFGHEKGAFTGAIACKPGKFELAHGGTLFLDEIGEMSPSTQVKMLRVLQEKEFERVGGTSTLKVDVRIISATNRNLKKAIAEKKFREDLFFRLNVINLALPSLRDRKEDVILLAGKFLHDYNKKFKRNIKDFSRDAIKALMHYNWPGNVRELENKVARAVILSTGEYIESLDLSLSHLKEVSAEFPVIRDELNLKQARKEFDRHFIGSRLKKYNWNMADTASSLGVERTGFYRLVKSLGLEKEVRKT